MSDVITKELLDRMGERYILTDCEPNEKILEIKRVGETAIQFWNIGTSIRVIEYDTFQRRENAFFGMTHGQAKTLLYGW